MSEILERATPRGSGIGLFLVWLSVASTMSLGTTSPVAAAPCCTECAPSQAQCQDTCYYGWGPSGVYPNSTELASCLGACDGYYNSCQSWCVTGGGCAEYEQEWFTCDWYGHFEGSTYVYDNVICYYDA